MAVSENDIRKIADLARLTFNDDDVPVLVSQLNGILSHMEALTDVDTRDVETAMRATLPNAGAPLREDVVAPIPMNSTAPILAPDSEDGFILVPRLSTHEAL